VGLGGLVPEVAVSDYVIANVMHEDGVHPTFVEVAVTRAPTRPRPMLTAFLAEQQRVAHAQERKP